MRIAETVGLCGLSLLLGIGSAGAMTPVSPEQIPRPEPDDGAARSLMP